jgi:peptidoglycan/xylan/chitin deacetylase (PgdA/CDA1 family)
MIGVIADPTEHDVVREFFEFFKTPWEFYQSDQHYDVLLCAGEGLVDTAPKAIIVYAGKKLCLDDQSGICVASHRTNGRVLARGEERIPIYGDSITFADRSGSFLTDDDSHECAAYVDEFSETMRARIGYDLFREIRRLLTIGQPSKYAEIPTLELHIALLRTLITGCGIPVVEIPPVPQGYQFIACLTHDVDHPSIRQHGLDHTIIGFLFRAVFGSVINALLGRMSIRDAAKNWMAAIKLPFVYMGLAKDFWRDFDDRYLELERGLASTFFVIPFKDYSGKTVGGPAPEFRASGYEAKELESTIRKLTAAGCEVGLHGIDAWLDRSKGCEEIEQIRSLTGLSEIGVRMHWLYYNDYSPATLEKAGAAYDSTIGYNETVGYRAGTTQAYKPLKADRLLELPMHAMDTALFFPSHQALSPKEASARLKQLADNAAQFGGCLTINWHDRSLAPERSWGGCYRDLIQDLKSRGAWFATASQATSWFRTRRSAAFEINAAEADVVRAKVTTDKSETLPGLRLRIHQATDLNEIGKRSLNRYADVVVDQSVHTCASGASR